MEALQISQKGHRIILQQNPCDIFINPWNHDTGGSCLSRTAVNPDSGLAWIFVAKFLCIFKLIIITG